MRLDWTDGELADGLRCYRNREFFAAHEHWEAVWLEAPEPEKTLLQAIIQVAAAFHHFERGNNIGTRSLLLAALRKLDLYQPVFAGLVVDRIRDDIRAWLAFLDAPSQLVRPPLPELDLI
jgi:predicted metal-dependent hydrolase